MVTITLSKWRSKRQVKFSNLDNSRKVKRSRHPAVKALSTSCQMGFWTLCPAPSTSLLEEKFGEKIPAHINLLNNLLSGYFIREEERTAKKASLDPLLFMVSTCCDRLEQFGRLRGRVPDQPFPFVLPVTLKAPSASLFISKRFKALGIKHIKKVMLMIHPNCNAISSGQLSAESFAFERRMRPPHGAVWEWQSVTVR